MLIKATVEDIKKYGEFAYCLALYMTYFCGEDEKLVLSKLGFKCVGQYVLYIK